MIPYSMVQSYGLTLDGLSEAALGDLQSLVAQTAALPYDQARLVLFEAFPELFGPYAIAASQVSATFYEEMRDVLELRGAFGAEVIEDAVDPARLNALVGYSTAPTVWEKGISQVFSLAAGGLVSMLSEMAADTIAGNAALDDRNTLGYQRVPRPGCCSFCGMLASRSADGRLYGSEEAALTVVGRGVPVPKVRRRGGQAKGIRPRGSRALGESFHDFCRCRAVPVTPKNAVQLQADADRYYDAYATARDEVSKGQKWHPGERNADGAKVTKGHWTDAEGKPRTNDEKQAQILAFMRADLGVK